MKRIVICLDGTWNTVGKTGTPTNVVRFVQSVAPRGADGIDQIAYYNAGVGTDGPIDKVLGGLLGTGLQRNVQRGYQFCALNYRPGDEIYIFGFSRGAYTARALAGIIAVVGLVRPEHFDRFEEVWASYRRYARRQSDKPTARTDPLTDRTVPIKCVGVWDTVGSYGIPAGLGLGALARMITWRNLHFRDTGLSHKVAVALHAVAIDEHRRPFAPTFWTRPVDKPLAGQACEQTWFAGAHSNVGGGYERHQLSDVALLWLMARVEESTDLRFDLAVLKDKVAPDVMADSADSLGWIYLLSRLFRFDRPMMSPCAIDIGLLWNSLDRGHVNINERVHWSVRKHLAGGRYRPTNIPGTLTPEQWAEITPREAELWKACGAAP